MPVLLLLAPFLVLLFWGLNGTRRVSSPCPEQKPFPYPVRITGFSYVTYNNQMPVIKVEADELKVNPRKYFVFNIRPFNEATLTNARIEVYFNGQEPSDVDPFSVGRELLSIKEEGKSRVKDMGLITRGLIKGLIVEIYKADEPWVIITAKEVIIDFKRKEATLVTARIEDTFSKMTITSKSVVWSSKDSVLRIPGVYRAETPSGKTSGKGLKLHLDGTLLLESGRVAGGA
jgi:hypothetical protein